MTGGECGGEMGATDMGTAAVEDSAGVLDSNVEGSAGGGPSTAHRRDSYLERIKESILLYNEVVSVCVQVEGKGTNWSGGWWPGFKWASQ